MERTVADRTLFGFWIYLMTDCILFAMLFCTYFVLRDGAVSVSLPYVLGQSVVLLASSFTCALAMLNPKSKRQVLGWFGITFLLGLLFLAMELAEFAQLVREGQSWRVSATLSAFFTLVATHGLHVAAGLLWMVVLLVPVVRSEMCATSWMRLSCLRMFWHFLDLVWIFLFTFIYLWGALS